MGFLGLFGDSRNVVASISFGFRADFEDTYLVSMGERGAFPEGFESWIWDLFYAKALYTVGKGPIADGLKSQLEGWAEEHVVPLLSGLPFPPEIILTLDPDLEITHSGPGKDEEVCELVIIQKLPSRRNPDAWPTIKTRIPRRGFQNRFASTVLVLAQHWMAKSTYFTRMLPFHILSMRRCYKERRDYSSVRSLLEAPAFAVQKEIDWTTNAEPSILEAWKK